MVLWDNAVRELSKEVQRDPMKKWESWTTRASKWYVNETFRTVDPNWQGRKAMRESLSNASLWWDEEAENYFLAKIEEVQYPINCSRVHLIGHRSWYGGMLSNVHALAQPLLLAVMKGHTIVDIDRNDNTIDTLHTNDTTVLGWAALSHNYPTFFGCSPGFQNLNCFLNLTTCSPFDVENRLKEAGLNLIDSSFPYVPWTAVLSNGEEFSSPGGVTVINDLRRVDWLDGIFTFSDVYNAGKVNLIHGMMEKGNVRVVNNAQKEGYENVGTDFMLMSMINSWMLSKLSDRVKSIADKIMSRYTDEEGRPAWTPPVLTIHIRQSDKTLEDPFWRANGRYRNAAEYIAPMKQLEGNFGFEWPTLFLMSDSGATLVDVAREINDCPGDFDPLSTYNSTAAARKDGKRLIIYDWTSDIHVIEKYGDHIHVPKEIKHDMEEHFLAAMYITQMISDYAIVTYSSNVGRFIGELLSAKHRIAMPAPVGPVATSLDGAWIVNL
ncbi:hypothetical protein R1flu_007800 [Riccia fluitans]|uniref:Uncharacterized protein n=1 Tax=Riccia fluitans TaxID=41844 RepID=A0ABD1Z0E6_9MARC